MPAGPSALVTGCRDLQAREITKPEVMVLIDEGLELLSEQQCHELLASGHVGRVGLTVGGLPVILPVNYAYVGGSIVFRTGEGTKLRAASDHAVIAFEVDAFDDDTRSGWSVLVIGRAAEITADEAAQELQRALPEPWVQERGHYVRVHDEMLTGRRIVRSA